MLTLIYLPEPPFIIPRPLPLSHHVFDSLSPDGASHEALIQLDSKMAPHSDQILQLGHGCRQQVL